MTIGTDLITTERRRQIDAEGLTPDHDENHAPGTLTMAAICYASIAGSGGAMRAELRTKMPNSSHWPWTREWWKPGADDSNASRIRELTKAGALIAAEIDRLSRKDQGQ